MSKSEMPPALTDLQQCLLVFSGLKNQIEPGFRAIKRHLMDDDLKFTVSNHLLILTCSFLEEWHRLEGLGKEGSVQQTLRAAKPAVDRIRKWPGIGKLRSSVLAHPLRNKDGSLIRIGALFGPMRAPTAYGETIIIAECAVYAIATAICRHTQEAKEGSAIWEAEEDNVVPDSIGKDATLTDVNAEIAQIRSRITAIDSTLEACFSGKLDC